MSKKICTFTVSAAALGLLAWAYKDDIQKCYGNISDKMKHSEGFRKAKKIFSHKRPILFYIYDSTGAECIYEKCGETAECDSLECHCTTQEAEPCSCSDICPCDSDDGEENNCKCECGCQDPIQEALEAYTEEADVIAVDLAYDSKSDIQLCENLMERFEITSLPVVLLLTRSANLIAKIESPDTPKDVCDIIDKYLR